MSDQKGLSRRDFLVSAGTFATSALVTGTILGTTVPAMAAAPALPWGYVALDPNIVAKAAYDAYKVGGCCYATAKALLDALATAVGSPWDTINPDMFKFGKGGIVSWGTLCGAVNGALCIVQMIIPTTDGCSPSYMQDEIMGWYTKNNFPSNQMDAFSPYPNQPQTVCGSPLCHQSASMWSYYTGFRINSAERKERCAKVAADVAYQTVTYLNTWKAGNFIATFQHDPSYSRCFSCHVGPDSRYDTVQAKTNCLQAGCHPEKVTHKVQ